MLDGTVVGCASLVYWKTIAVFHSLAVQKHWRHRGVGSELMKQRLHDARGAGSEMACLMTMFWNVNFFRRFGFETTSRKLLPKDLAGCSLIHDPAFLKATPMLCVL